MESEKEEAVRKAMKMHGSWRSDASDVIGAEECILASRGAQEATLTVFRQGVRVWVEDRKGGTT